MNVDLIEFLRTGVFGEIVLGEQTTRDLVAMLGEPDSIIGDAALGFSYGDAEIYRVGPTDDRLCTIYFDAFGVPRGNDRLTINAGWIRSEITKEFAEQMLAAAGIGFRPIEMPDPDMVGIKTEGGVELGFIVQADEYSAPAGLYSIAKELDNLTELRCVRSAR